MLLPLLGPLSFPSLTYSDVFTADIRCQQPHRQSCLDIFIPPVHTPCIQHDSQSLRKGKQLVWEAGTDEHGHDESRVSDDGMNERTSEWMLSVWFGLGVPTDINSQHHGKEQPRPRIMRSDGKQVREGKKQGCC